jgi:hypothetical protein
MKTVSVLRLLHTELLALFKQQYLLLAPLAQQFGIIEALFGHLAGGQVA